MIIQLSISGLVAVAVAKVPPTVPSPATESPMCVRQSDYDVYIMSEMHMGRAKPPSPPGYKFMAVHQSRNKKPLSFVGIDY
eukprot:scaffold225216_cov36-Prasinocladus_malaysianus.AAC.1